MKAIYLEESGSVSVLQYGDIKVPEDCGENQVLVYIKAIGINPIDCKIRAAPERFPVTFPVIPDCDDAGLLALKPHAFHLFEQAAAAPLVFITAWGEALHDRAHITRDQTILIHAGAGGVRHAATQFAKLVGTKAITTVSSEEKDNFAQRLGVDKVINLRFPVVLPRG
jgi:NADPH2:quinone reductase